MLRFGIAGIVLYMQAAALLSFFPVSALVARLKEENETHIHQVLTKKCKVAVRAFVGRSANREGPSDLK